MAKETKEVAVVDNKSTALAVADLSSYETDADAGFENTTKDDFSIPFIRVLQPTSPTVVDQVEGHKGGHWINTATGEVYPEVNFVPAATQRLFVEWVPRRPDGTLPPDAGSGFVAIHKPEDEIVTNAKQASVEFGSYSTPGGNDLVDTHYLYGLCISPTGEMFEAVIAFSSTHIKACQNLMTMARNQAFVTSKGERKRLPVFSHKFKLSTTKKERGGNKWFIPLPDWGGKDGDEKSSLLAADSAEYLAAREIHRQFNAGLTKVDLTQTARATGGGDAGNAGNDKDIPF